MDMGSFYKSCNIIATTSIAKGGRGNIICRPQSGNCGKDKSDYEHCRIESTKDKLHRGDLLLNISC